MTTGTELTLDRLLAAREERYRRTMALRVTDQNQAAEFVSDVGFCFLFPIRGVEMPSLWDAIAGRVVETTSQHSGYEIERTWGWKDESLDKRWWYYGKLIRSKATLVGLDFLPNFYALSTNFGDFQNDYLEEYANGSLTYEAKQIYETLLNRGAMDAVALRQESHISAEADSPRFDKALTELQVGLMVLPVGVARAGAWRYAFVYEILPRWLADVPERARAISTRAARAAILEQYLRNVIAAPLRSAARVFGWPLDDARETAAMLESEGRIRLNVRVEGVKDLLAVTESAYR